MSTAMVIAKKILERKRFRADLTFLILGALIAVVEDLLRWIEDRADAGASYLGRLFNALDKWHEDA